MPALTPCTAWVTGADLDCDGDPDDLDAAAVAASDALFVLTGAQFPGECPRTTYVDDEHHCCLQPIVETAYLNREYWSDYIGWTCCSGERITLGWAEVVSVESVTIDGGVVPPSEYRLEDHRDLVRVDGSSWPRRGMVVELTAGLAPPIMATMAAAELACAIVKFNVQAAGGADCALPANTRSFIRNGLQATMQEPAKAKEGQVGLPITDMLLSIYNPEGLTEQPIVAVPGRPPYTHVRH